MLGVKSSMALAMANKCSLPHIQRQKILWENSNLSCRTCFLGLWHMLEITFAIIFHCLCRLNALSEINLYICCHIHDCLKHHLQLNCIFCDYWIFVLTKLFSFSVFGLPKSMTKSKPIFKIPSNVMSPYNAHAVLHFKSAFWALYLPISVDSRISDIWRSYFSKARFSLCLKMFT